MYRDLFDRRRLALPLVIPALGGLIYLLRFDAPARYWQINGAALIAALLWIGCGRLPRGTAARRVLATVLIALLFLPLASGPDIDGVSRWLSLGPVTLNSGMLVAPLLAMLCASDLKRGPLLHMAALAAAALQPDAALAIALAGSALAMAAASWNKAFAVTGLLGLIVTAYAFTAGNLAPQPFVEGIVGQLWIVEPTTAVAVLVVLATAVWMLAWETQMLAEEAWALAAMLTGFAAIALLATYPLPLFGYGAAPILGFGLALGAVGRKHERDVGELLALATRNRS